MTNDVDAERSVARLKRWVVEDALPLWGETGFDAARGSFVERLTFEGAPLLVGAEARHGAGAPNLCLFACGAARLAA